MKILKIILFVFLGLIGLILILGLIAPKEFGGKSEILINKPQQEVYDYIKFLKNQDNYGTWNQHDPNMKKTFTGTDGTVGFTYAWESDHNMVGDGKQTITNLVEGEKMESELYFGDFEDPAKSVIQLTPKSPDQTLVKWEVTGKTPYPWNIMNLFFSMDGDFQKGLENLKREVEHN